MRSQSVFTFSLLLVLALYDLAVVVIHGTNSSISQWIVDTTNCSPIQSFTCGVLCCHFFGWMMFPKGKSTQPERAIELATKKAPK